MNMYSRKLYQHTVGSHNVIKEPLEKVYLTIVCPMYFFEYIGLFCLVEKEVTMKTFVENFKEY